MKKPIGEQVFNVTNYLFVGFIAFTCLYPFLYIIALSFSSSRAITSGEVFIIPIEPSIEAYRQLLEDGQIFRAMGNTVFLTVVGVALNMFCTILCSYALSKKRLDGRNIVMGMIVFTMLFGGGLIPTFLLIRNLGLMNTYGALWFSSLQSTYNMIVLRTFFQGIPESLEEAAQIDGANDPYILVRIVLPLSGAALATIVLFYAVGWWNSFFSAMIYLSSPEKWPLMVRLRAMLDTAGNARFVDEVTGDQITVLQESFRAASMLISITPIICVYPFLQKYFVKGVMIGSLKG